MSLEHKKRLGTHGTTADSSEFKSKIKTLLTDSNVRILLKKFGLELDQTYSEGEIITNSRGWKVRWVTEMDYARDGENFRNQFKKMVQEAVDKKNGKNTPTKRFLSTETKSPDIHVITPTTKSTDTPLLPTPMAHGSNLPAMSLSEELESEDEQQKKPIDMKQIVDGLLKDMKNLLRSKAYYKNKCKMLEKELENLKEKLIRLTPETSQNSRDMPPIIPAVDEEASLQDEAPTTVGCALYDLILQSGAYLESGTDYLSVKAGFQCHNLVTICKVPKRMLPQVVGTVIQMLFGEIEEDFLDRILKHWDTFFFWLFHHSTKMGEESLKVLGFLSSHFNRICILLLASMNSHHLLWAGFRFADSKGKENATLSARMKDIPVFFRNLWEFLDGLEKDWKSVLGQYSIYIRMR